MARPNSGARISASPVPAGPSAPSLPDGPGLPVGGDDPAREVHGQKPGRHLVHEVVGLGPQAPQETPVVEEKEKGDQGQPAAQKPPPPTRPDWRISARRAALYSSRGSNTTPKRGSRSASREPDRPDIIPLCPKPMFSTGRIIKNPSGVNRPRTCSPCLLRF